MIQVDTSNTDPKIFFFRNLERKKFCVKVLLLIFSSQHSPHLVQSQEFDCGIGTKAKVLNGKIIQYTGTLGFT